MPRQKRHIGNSELISAVNSRLVLQAVRALQPTFRAEVARQTNLKPATVTGIVNYLIEQGLLQQTPTAGEVGPRGGRPPQMLRVNGAGHRILAVDLEPDVIRVAVTDLLVETPTFLEEAIDRFSEPDPICSRIVALCRDLLASTGSGAFLGMGVSLPGLIDREEGVLLSSTNMPRWRDVPVRAILERELELPVRIDRSVHLAALHEQWTDPLHRERTKLLISLRTGIGMTLLHQGDIYMGAKGFDGEIGHTVVDINGKECECGSRGCLETLVSASAICERARAMMAEGRGEALTRRLDDGDTLRPELIYALARGGDADCADVVRHVGRYIGIAVSNMINLFAPEEVVICGSIDTADELIMEAVRGQIQASALPKLRENVVVRLAHALEKAPLLGAAVLVARDLFELPRLDHQAVVA